MQNILCYGDSNTWGYIPGSGTRYPHNQRWTTLLQQRLGASFRIIEEGLNGRTTVWDDPFRHGRNGKDMLYPLLESHAPIDLVVLMLGTNDLKHYYSVYAPDIARGAEVLINSIKSSSLDPQGAAPQVLLIAPPTISKLSVALKQQFRGAREKSLDFAKYYQQIAETSACHFLDAAQFVSASTIDGVHLDQAEHAKFADTLYHKVISIFPEHS